MRPGDSHVWQIRKETSGEGSGQVFGISQMRPKKVQKGLAEIFLRRLEIEGMWCSGDFDILEGNIQRFETLDEIA